ncbi:MAG: hypothetical protein P8Y97_13350 [Candidatus Lokiarchaeota archaeon]
MKKEINESQDQINLNLEFDLKAGLISALYEFAKNIDKSIQLLEFKTKTENSKSNKPNQKESEQYSGDVLITLTTEPFLLHKSVHKKIELIYEMIIASKIPLDAAYEILGNEEDILKEILTDKEAHRNIERNLNQVEKASKIMLGEMKNYGLKGICITSFDLSPLKIFSKEYKLKDIYQILRNIGFIPEIQPFEWVYRQSFINNNPIWLFIIKSGVGPTIHHTLFETYFYLLIVEPNSYLGEFPKKVIERFNQILG